MNKLEQLALLETGDFVHYIKKIEAHGVNGAFHSIPYTISGFIPEIEDLIINTPELKFSIILLDLAGSQTTSKYTLIRIAQSKHCYDNKNLARKLIYNPNCPTKIKKMLRRKYNMVLKWGRYSKYKLGNIGLRP